MKNILKIWKSLGEGIKYYKNGTKKIKGKFKNIFKQDGIYYELHGKII